MENQEYLKRRENICPLPFTGITLGPTGHITLCCNSPEFHLGHISEIPDLTKFFNGDRYNYHRDEMEAGRLHELPNCTWCYHAQKDGTVTVRNYADFEWAPYLQPNFDKDWHTRKSGGQAPIRYLEYTPSNSCNQACSTCNSFYSSKWEKIEAGMTPFEREYFARKDHSFISISDQDLEKIYDILPGLTQITIKGGEPWADKRNIKILDRLMDVNPGCAIYIVSNMSFLSEAAWDLVRRLRDHKGFVNLSASVDGIDKVYEWIRSTPFEVTVANLRKFYELSGKKVAISTCVSVHNYFHLRKILHYFKDKEYVHYISFSNPARQHDYLESRALPQDVLAKWRDKYLREFSEMKKELNRNYTKFVYAVVENESSGPHPPEEIHRVFLWIDKMNAARGFKLEDHIPELRKLRRRINGEKEESRILTWARSLSERFIHGQHGV